MCLEIVSRSHGLCVKMSGIWVEDPMRAFRVNGVEAHVRGSQKEDLPSKINIKSRHSNIIRICRQYHKISRLMVEDAVGEWIQSIACIFSIKDPWRITAPTRSRAKMEEFDQYRDIMRRMAIFSVRSRTPFQVLCLTFRMTEVFLIASSINVRIVATVAEGLKRGSV